MVQIKMFAICLASVFVLNFVNCADIELNVQNLTRFLMANPKLKLELIQNFTQVKNSQVKYQSTYRFGNRVFGDREIEQNTFHNQWSQPRDLRFTLTYPRDQVGAVITYVQVDVEQSSNVGRGYVVAGGIWQRTIQIVIEAQNTLYYNIRMTLFGYN